MGRLLGFLVVLVAVVVVLGFYRGWFELSTAGTERKTNVTISVDKDKIRDDKEKAKEKIKEGLQETKKEVREDVKKLKAKADQATHDSDRHHDRP